MTTAPRADQLKLLDLQALDTRSAQIAHRRKTLPEIAALADVAAREATLRDRAVAARTLVSDLQREVTSAEEDVRQVRERAERNQARLDSGAGAKDATALQRDLEALARRQGVLEENELEVMERLEQAQAAAAVLTAEEAELAAERARLQSAREAALGVLAGEADDVARQREQLAGRIDTALVAVYEKARAQQSGVGAVALRGTRTVGWWGELSTSELSRIRSAAPDEVVRPEEGGPILVRFEAETEDAS